MMFELLRLILGFLIAAFHRPIADYIMERERVLVTAFRQRGIPAPMFSRDAARNVYFCLGILIVLLEMARIWSLAHPDSIFLFMLSR